MVLCERRQRDQKNKEAHGKQRSIPDYGVIGFKKAGGTHIAAAAKDRMSAMVHRRFICKSAPKPGYFPRAERSSSSNNIDRRGAVSVRPPKRMALYALVNSSTARPRGAAGSDRANSTGVNQIGF